MVPDVRAFSESSGVGYGWEEYPCMQVLWRALACGVGYGWEGYRLSRVGAVASASRKTDVVRRCASCCSRRRALCCRERRVCISACIWKREPSSRSSVVRAHRRSDARKVRRRPCASPTCTSAHRDASVRCGRTMLSTPSARQRTSAANAARRTTKLASREAVCSQRVTAAHRVIEVRSE